MTPVAVPIVSKKSVSMIVKITRSAVRRPSFSNGSVRLNWPIVAKLGVTPITSGIFWTPAAIAITDVMRMLRISAARIFMTYSAIVIARPTRKTNWAVVVG